MNCVICTGEYIKRRMGQKTCSPVCEAERKRQVKIKKERYERLKTKSDYAKDAEKAFNAFIRERDSHLPCISCGRHHAGANHAGHYRSVAAAPNLRFNEDNVHRQCAPCNTHKSGNLIEYRINLIKKIGLQRVEELECMNTPARYTVDELKELKRLYTQKLKDLKASR